MCSITTFCYSIKIHLIFMWSNFIVGCVSVYDQAKEEGLNKECKEKTLHSTDTKSMHGRVKEWSGKNVTQPADAHN